MHVAGFHQNLTNNKKYERARLIVDQILDSDIDIICLQELFHHGIRQYFVRRLSNMYPFHVLSAQQNCVWNSGLAIFSRRELSYVTEHEFVQKGNWLQRLVPRTYLSCRVDGVTVINAHLTSPEFYWSRTVHLRCVQDQLAEILALVNKNYIICGDLNHCDNDVDELTLNVDSFLTTTYSKQSNLTTTDKFITDNSGDTEILSSWTDSDHFPVLFES